MFGYHHPWDHYGHRWDGIACLVPATVLQDLCRMARITRRKLSPNKIIG
jgi:hypothetical protein